MEHARILKIFLASPRDVKPEREMIFALKDDLDHVIGRPYQIRFEFVNWERSAYPGIGEDAQDVINQNIDGDYDIFLGIFWQRFGTPTNRAESGTKEEYDRAYLKYKAAPDSNHLMLYFKTAAPQNIYDIDYDQFEKVKKFKTEASDQGVLYFEFQTPEDLKNHLLIHLTSLVRAKFSQQSKHEAHLSEVDRDSAKMDKYELMAQQIEVGESNLNNEGILELTEQASDGMRKLPNITKIITSSVKFISEKFTERTNQLNAISKIKDNRLRLKKTNVVINNSARDLDKYSSDLNDFLPEFKEALNSAVESYSKLLLMANESNLFIDEVERQLIHTIPELYSSIDNALEGIANFLQGLRNLPVMTSKFGTAKRKAELVTNEVFKEFIGAKKVMKQLIERIKGDLN